MRERTWLTTTDPEPMLRFLKGRATDRKARLLVCTAARLAWKQLTDERSRRAVEVGERYADGLAEKGSLWPVYDELAAEVMMETPPRAVVNTTWPGPA